MAISIAAVATTKIMNIIVIELMVIRDLIITIHHQPKITHPKIATVTASQTAAKSLKRMKTDHTNQLHHIFTSRVIIDINPKVATIKPILAMTGTNATRTLTAMQTKTIAMATKIEAGMHR